MLELRLSPQSLVDITATKL